MASMHRKDIAIPQPEPACILYQSLDAGAARIAPPLRESLLPTERPLRHAQFADHLTDKTVFFGIVELRPVRQTARVKYDVLSSLVDLLLKTDGGVLEMTGICTEKGQKRKRVR